MFPLLTTKETPSKDRITPPKVRQLRDSPINRLAIQAVKTGLTTMIRAAVIAVVYCRPAAKK